MADRDGARSDEPTGEFVPSTAADNTDERLVIGLLQVMRREMSANHESTREELKRLREAIEAHATDHEDTQARVLRLEQNAKRRLKK